MNPRTPFCLLGLALLGLITGCTTPTERADAAPAPQAQAQAQPQRQERTYVSGGLGSRIPRRVDSTTTSSAAARGGSPEARADGDAVRDVFREGLSSSGVGESGP